MCGYSWVQNEMVTNELGFTKITYNNSMVLNKSAIDCSKEAIQKEMITIESKQPNHYY